MAKKSSPRSNKKLRTGALALIAVVAVGLSYAAASTDLAYGAQSVLAAIGGAFNTSPHIDITRSATSRSAGFWSTGIVSLATFDVTPKNFAFGYLRRFTADVQVAPNSNDFRLSQFGMRYSYCGSSGCRTIEVPVDHMTSSTSPMGTVYSFSSPGSLDVGLNGKAPTTSSLDIYARPYFSTVYNDAKSSEAKIVVSLGGVEGGADVCTNTTPATCARTSVPVSTILARGYTLTLNRGVAFGYGYWDLDSNGILAAPDSLMLAKIAVGTLACPLFKLCDINGNGSVTVADSALLLKYAVGSVPPPVSAAGSALSVTAGASNPQASSVTVSSSTTSGVALMGFNLTAKGKSMKVSSVGVTLSTSDNSLGDVVSSVRLMKGSTVLASKAAPSGNSGLVVFNNLAEAFSVDTSAAYTVVVDVKGDAAYADGTTLAASTAGTGWDVTDASGARISPSGSVAGGVATLRARGVTITPSLVFATVQPASIAGAGDVGSYIMNFTVTAGDTDVYIGRNYTYANGLPASGGGIVYTLTSTTATKPTNVITNITTQTITPADTAAAFKIPAHTSRVFALDVLATAAATGYVGYQIQGINYSSSAAMGSAYYTTGAYVVKTQDLMLTKH